MAVLNYSNHRHPFTKIPAVLAVLFVTLAAVAPAWSQQSGWTRLSGHVPPQEGISTPLGDVDASQPMDLAIALPLRNMAGLNNLISELYDPTDPLYGHYLTPDEFTAQFGPTQSDYDAVIAYCKDHGLTVTGTFPNRMIVDVHGTAGAVQSAFAVHITNFMGHDGRPFFAPDGNPAVPSDLAGRISAIAGLDNALVLSTHATALTPQAAAMMGATPHGSGVGGALSPSDIRTAYSMTDVPETGTGQTIGLFELDGYNMADITNFEGTYSLPSVPITNVLVDGFSGNPSGGGGQFEVSMDIELQMALDPGLSSIRVYEGPNSGNGILDTYTHIANDNLAKTVSTSWGAAEYKGGAAFYNAENNIFQEMAVQGQSIFAASGDSGAYDNGSTLSVDDPASQPFMTGCGGTTLSLMGQGQWSSETTWSDASDTSNSPMGEGGGGGVSIIWPQPAWQSGVGISSTMRNVPDVVLDANPFTGYSTVVQGQWYYGGGTSAAAPLWAALTALVNERRLAGGSSYIGFVNPELYAIGKSPLYSTTFHDIADGSTNLFYHATAGYDDATGWGSFIGDNLIAALTSSSTVAVVAPKAPTGLAAVSGDASATLTWNAPAGASTYNVERANTYLSPYVVIATGVANPTYHDTNLKNGITCYYKVQAVNSAGTSPFTGWVTATPMPAIPAAPTGVMATSGNAQVTVSWTAVPEAASYVIKRALTPGGAFATIATVTGTTYTNLSLANYQTYYYEVCATNMSGTGPVSSVASATPQLPVPAAPVNLTAALSGKSVVLRWTASTYASSYNVERATTSGGTYTVIKSGLVALAFTDSTGVSGATYYYVVTAQNPTGTSGTSNQTSAKIPSSGSTIGGGGTGTGGSTGGTGGSTGGTGGGSTGGTGGWKFHW